MSNLSTQIRKSYTYLILFYDGSFYYGVRLCPKGKTPWQDTEYVGSPVTHKNKWNNTPFTKFILEVFDDYEKAQQKEKQLIRPYINYNVCLNESAGFLFSYKSCSEGGKKAGRRAIESGQLASIQSIGGKTQGRKNVESGHLKNISSLGGKIMGKIQGRKNLESGHIKNLGKKWGKENAKKLHSQKWKCLITGFVSTPGGLSSYQRARGIDTSMRERIL